MKEVKWYCDICHNEIKSNEKYFRFKLVQPITIDYEQDYDVCVDCAKKVFNLTSPNKEYYESDELPFE